MTTNKTEHTDRLALLSELAYAATETEANGLNSKQALEKKLAEMR